MDMRSLLTLIASLGLAIISVSTRYNNSHANLSHNYEGSTLCSERTFDQCWGDTIRQLEAISESVVTSNDVALTIPSLQ